MGITDRQGEWLCRGYSTLSLINSSAINDFDFCSGYLFDVHWRGSDLLSFVIHICFNAGGHLFWITCSRWVLFAGITFAWVRRIYEMKLVPGMSRGKRLSQVESAASLSKALGRDILHRRPLPSTASLHLDLNSSSQPSSTLRKVSYPNQDISLLFTVITP